MMKKIKLSKPVNLNLLTEELFAAFPEWKYPDPLGRGWDVTEAAIEPEAVTFPDASDEKGVQAVIDAHDPQKDSANQAKAKEDAAALSGAIEKLKGLGLSEKEIEILRGARVSASVDKIKPDKE